MAACSSPVSCRGPFPIARARTSPDGRNRTSTSRTRWLARSTQSRDSTAPLIRRSPAHGALLTGALSGHYVLSFDGAELRGLSDPLRVELRDRDGIVLRVTAIP